MKVKTISALTTLWKTTWIFGDDLRTTLGEGTLTDESGTSGSLVEDFGNGDSLKAGWPLLPPPLDDPRPENALGTVDDLLGTTAHWTTPRKSEIKSPPSR